MGLVEADVAQSVFSLRSSNEGVSGGAAKAGSCGDPLPTSCGQGPGSALKHVQAVWAKVTEPRLLHGRLVPPGPRADVTRAVRAKGRSVPCITLNQPVLAGAAKGQGLCPPEHL